MRSSCVYAANKNASIYGVELYVSLYLFNGFAEPISR